MSNERKFRLQVTEGELSALIHHHSMIIQNLIEAEKQVTSEMSERLHDLVKRLNRTTPEIEGDQRPATTAEIDHEIAATNTNKQGW